jgi:hypothetical protein
MQSKITIQQVDEEAAKHEAIAALYRAITGSLKNLNPNIELLISNSRMVPDQPIIQAEQARASHAPRPQSSSSKMDALVQVLRDAPKPMMKYSIKAAMEKLGHEITEETLGSYLSRNKDKLFKNPKRGYWKLAEQVSSSEQPKTD